MRYMILRWRGRKQNTPKICKKDKALLSDSTMSYKNLQKKIGRASKNDPQIDTGCPGQITKQSIIWLESGFIRHKRTISLSRSPCATNEIGDRCRSRRSKLELDRYDNLSHELESSQHRGAEWGIKTRYVLNIERTINYFDFTWICSGGWRENAVEVLRERRINIY